MARKITKGRHPQGRSLSKARMTSGGGSFLTGRGFATQSAGSRGGRKLTKNTRP